MEKGKRFFSHDSNAMNDPKCMLLVEQFGMEGYGAFWGLIEMLSVQPNYCLPIILIPSIAKRFSMSEAKIKTIIENYGLFRLTEDSFFYSKSLKNRMKLMIGKQSKRSIAGSIAGKKSGESRRKKALLTSNVARIENKQKYMLCSDNERYTNDRSTNVQQSFNNRSENEEKTTLFADNEVVMNDRSTNVQQSFNDRSYSADNEYIMDAVIDNEVVMNDCSTNVQQSFNDRSYNADNEYNMGECSTNVQQDEKSPHIYINNINIKDKYKNMYVCNSEKKKSTAAANFFPPSVEEVRVYCNERKNNIDPEKFIDFYSSKGWMIGRNKMKDWKASVRTWEKQDKDNSTYQNNKNSNETENSRYSKL